MIYQCLNAQKRAYKRDHICAVPEPVGICGDFDNSVNILFSTMSCLVTLLQWKNISMQFIQMDIVLCST